MLCSEAFVDLHLISAGESVRLVRHPDNRHDFGEHLVGHARFTRGRGVRRDAIAALVSGADGHIEQFFDERIERARAHHFFHALPGTAQRDRIVGEGFPEVIDPVRLAGGHDVVIDGAYFRGSGFVFNKSESCHRSPDHLNSFVQPECFIGSQHGNAFDNRLRNDLAIEGVGMVQRQIKQLRGVVRRPGKDTRIQIFDGRKNVSPREIQLAQRGLDGDLRKG